MNDFTKEELQEIKRCIKYMINGGVTPYSVTTVRLIVKLNEMIEHYCEHDWQQGKHLFKDVYCTKCTKSFEGTKEMSLATLHNKE